MLIFIYIFIYIHIFIYIFTYIYIMIYIYRSSLNPWRQFISKQESILLISNLVTEATIVNTMTCKFNWFIL